MPKIDWSKRSAETEIMDDFELGGSEMDQTLIEIARINQLLGGNNITLSSVIRLIKKSNSKGPIKILDIGCGGGEILRLLADWGRKESIEMELVGIDANPSICEFASSQSRDYPEISYLPINVFSVEFANLSCDIIVATLVFHHFSDEQISRLLKLSDQIASQGVVINDLHRHWFAYHSINLLTALFAKSRMVRNDAGVSVLRSFSRKELENLLKGSGIVNYNLKWRWAFRWELTWENHVDSSN